MFAKATTVIFCLSLALMVHAGVAFAQNERSCSLMGTRVVKYCSIQVSRRGGPASSTHKRLLKRALIAKKCAQVSRQFRQQCNLSPQLDAMCILNVKPVCGLRAETLVLKTYSNSCLAFIDGAISLYRGVCR